MSDSLNMTLDEIVKRSKTAKAGGKGISRHGDRGKIVGAGRGARPARRGPLAVNARPSSFSINKLARRKRNLPWQNDLFEESMRAVRVPSVELGTKVHVTNLDQGVTHGDIKELFGEIGEMERFAIHYDQSGRPNGSAEIVYIRRSDAFQAVKRYHNVLLDRRPMKVEIVGGNTEEAAPVRRVSGLNGSTMQKVFVGQGRRRVVSAPSVRRLPIGSQNQQGGARGGRGGFRGNGNSQGQGQGRSSGGRGSKSGGQGGKKTVEKSAAELDKDLESYHAEAMNIN